MKNLNGFLVVLVSVFIIVFSLISPINILAAGPATVNLGTAGNFIILAKTGISTTGTTSVGGDIGVSPAAATFITGFDLILPAASTFSSSALVTGKIYAPGYANPTPANMTTAISDMQTAYTNAMGRTNPTATELGAGNIGGMTLAPGLYKWGTGVTIPTDVTLSGGASDVWIFQIAQNLNISSAKKVILSGGAQAGNIFWAVAGQTTIGTTAVFNGNILDQTTIVLNTGATLNGRALAQAAVTLDANSVIFPNTTLDTTPIISNPISCTQEAKQCSDGSYVSRTGSSCEFASCPTIFINNTNSTPVVDTGCSGGNLHNTSTGALCVNNAVSQGCSGGNLYNISTGLLCNNTAIKTYNFGSTTLKNGSSGNAVMELQRFLNQILNLGLVIDGKLGPKTITVIKQWQKDNGLVADGLVGNKTKIKMNIEAGSAQ